MSPALYVNNVCEGQFCLNWVWVHLRPLCLVDVSSCQLSVGMGLMREPQATAARGALNSSHGTLGTCSINRSIFSVPQVAEAWPEHCWGEFPGWSTHPVIIFSTAGGFLFFFFFFMVTSTDVLKVLWFSDSTQIISKNFNNYLCILKSLFTINNTEESSPTMDVYYLEWWSEECSSSFLLTEFSSKMWLWLRR